MKLSRKMIGLGMLVATASLFASKTLRLERSFGPSGERETTSLFVKLPGNTAYEMGYDHPMNMFYRVNWNDPKKMQKRLGN
jgi:hypothetical protein